MPALLASPHATPATASQPTHFTQHFTSHLTRPRTHTAQVKDVSENPLAKVSRMVGGRKGGGGDLATGDKALETQVLEASIHKICSLLSVSEWEGGEGGRVKGMQAGAGLVPVFALLNLAPSN